MKFKELLERALKSGKTNDKVELFVQIDDTVYEVVDLDMSHPSNRIYLIAE